MEPLTLDTLKNVCLPGMLRVALIVSKQAYNNSIMLRHVHIEEFSAWYTSAKAYIIRGDRYDTLVFRGTKEPVDWLIDAMVVPVYYGGSWCHSGFAFSHWSIWKKIKRAIDDSKPLLVTGHSLGGGNADKTCDFLLNHYNGVHMITFGKPNVHLKNQNPYRGHLHTHLSVVSGSDLVTRLPRLLYRAHRDQNMLYLANNGVNYIDPGREYVHNDFCLADSLSDHSISGVYESRVLAMTAEAQ